MNKRFLIGVVAIPLMLIIVGIISFSSSSFLDNEPSQDLVDPVNQVDRSDKLLTINSEDASSVVALEDKSIPPFTTISILFLSIACLCSVSISFYLYRWRKILISRPHLLVPEEWGRYLGEVGIGLKALSSNTEIQLTSLEKSNSELSERISNMTETYMDLHNILDEKDKEIQRLRDGYDSEIFRRYISRFARVHQTLSEFIEDGDESPSLKMLDRLFDDAFAESGVERYSPVVGEDYRVAKGVSDKPKFTMTNDPSLEFQILEVIEAGYELVLGESTKTIIPSKVKIYKLDKDNQ